MLIIPAIDLKEGKVVRFTQGRFNQRIYSNDPVRTARHWVRQGAKYLHVVDLDGAIKGEVKNLSVIKAIVKSVNVPVECGGGVRKKETIRKLIDTGVERVVLGTLALKGEGLLREIFKRFAAKVIVSIDEAGGEVLTCGWRNKAKNITALDLAKQLEEIGFDKVIYTDTTRDGTLNGPNRRGIVKILNNVRLKLIASGGISSLRDIQVLRKLEKRGLSAVIVGKALYEGRFTLTEAIKAARNGC